MATPDERTQKSEAVKKGLEEISKIDPNNLSRKSELSRDINFDDAVPHFTIMLDLVKQLNDRDISRLSTPQLNKISEALNRIILLINKVNEFSLNQNTPADVCNGIINDVKNAYDNVMEPLTLPLAFTATQSTDYAKIEREAKGYHLTMKEESEKLAKYIEECRYEAESALSAVKEQAAEAGVSTNAQIFLQNSETHKDDATRWLKTTISVTAITFIAAVGFLIISFYHKPTGLPESIQYVVSKIIVLSTLSFGIFWSAKNYRAHKHNETLNKHRANALMTFRAFVEGSSDEKIKDIILLQASQAAFSSRPTGYDAGEKEGQSVNPIFEIIGKSIREVKDTQAT